MSSVEEPRTETATFDTGFPYQPPVDSGWWDHECERRRPEAAHRLQLWGRMQSGLLLHDRLTRANQSVAWIRNLPARVT